MILRLLCLPFYFIAFAGVILLPVISVTSFAKGQPQEIFGAVAALGVLPVLLTYLHAARIEHFILRTLPRTARSAYVAGEFIMSPSQSARCLYAHHRLLEVIEAQKYAVDELTYNKGAALAKRHRTLSWLSLIGFVFVLVGFLGFEYLAKNNA